MLKITFLPLTFLLLFTFSSAYTQAPQEPINVGYQLISEGKNKEAIVIFKQLYQAAPYDKKLYDELVKLYSKEKAFDEIIQLADYMIQIKPEDLGILVDKGFAIESKGDKKAALLIYNQAISQIKGYESQVISLANTFAFYNLKSYEIKTYEQSQSMSGNPSQFANQLHLLYEQSGDYVGTAQKIIQNFNETQSNINEIELSLKSLIEKDKNVQKVINKDLEKRLKSDPNAYHIFELYVRLMDKQDSKTLDAVFKFDEQNKQDGRVVYRVLERNLVLGHRSNFEKGYAYLQKINNSDPEYKAQISYLRIKYLNDTLSIVAYNNPTLLQSLKKEYELYFQNISPESEIRFYLQYTDLLFIRFNERQKAIDALLALNNDEAVENTALLKIKLGDYYLMEDNYWDATLYYMQVVKLFRQNYLGELAKFKVANLAYYQGRFEYAVTQLSDLKTATTDYIANDAIALSVLITENIGDTLTSETFKQFARANMLFFQQKNDESLLILDSLSTPQQAKHPLMDDILLLKAKIFNQQAKYDQSILLLKQLIEAHGDDVLADDALLMLSNVYIGQHDTKNALLYLNKLVTEYPGSNFVLECKTKIANLTNNK